MNAKAIVVWVLLLLLFIAVWAGAVLCVYVLADVVVFELERGGGDQNAAGELVVWVMMRPAALVVELAFTVAIAFAIGALAKVPGSTISPVTVLVVAVSVTLCLTLFAVAVLLAGFAPLG